MYFLKLSILPHQWYRSFIQHISQPFSASVADPALSIVLSGIICHDCISRQLLQLLRIIKTSNVTYFCNKSADCNQSDSFDFHQFINIWNRLQFFLYSLEQFLHPWHIYIHVIQQILQFNPCRFRCFLTSNAMLCSWYQDLCPLHSSASQLRVSPNLVYTVHSKYSDILRQWSFLEYHSSADCH